MLQLRIVEILAGTWAARSTGLTTVVFAQVVLLRVLDRSPWCLHAPRTGALPSQFTTLNSQSSFSNSVRTAYICARSPLWRHWETGGVSEAVCIDCAARHHGLRRMERFGIRQALHGTVAERPCKAGGGSGVVIVHIKLRQGRECPSFHRSVPRTARLVCETLRNSQRLVSHIAARIGSHRADRWDQEK